jgi:hypothetical protein
MFDLEEQIRKWRLSLPEALRGRTEAVDELESHVRDDWQRLVAAPLEPAQAWQEALRRLGDSGQLAAEFARVPAMPAGWLPARVALYVPAIVALLALAVAYRLGGGRGDWLLAAHVFCVTLGYVTAFVVGALAVWSIFSRALAGWGERHAGALHAAAARLTLTSLTLTAVGVVLGSVWSFDSWGQVWGWDLAEIGGLAVLTWNGVLAYCLWRRPRAGIPEMLLGVAGNIVVSLSWFGPALWGNMHSYGVNHSRATLLLASFVMVQLLILCVPLVPPRRTQVE